MIEYRLFFATGLLIIVMGFLGNWMYSNYREYQEKLEADFEEANDDWHSGTNESNRL